MLCRGRRWSRPRRDRKRAQRQMGQPISSVIPDRYNSHLNRALRSISQVRMPDPAYLEPHTGRTYPIAIPRWCSDDQVPLLLTPLPGLTRGQIDTAERSLWRYRAALPWPVAAAISMGEGRTPLISRTLHGVPVLLKCDWMN